MTLGSGIPVLSPASRARSFDEVVGPVRPQWAVAEARRCLLCDDAPCVRGCPAGVDIPRFIRALRSQSFAAAIRAIRETNVLAGICARVCPAESQCQSACSSDKLREPIAIAALQRFAADEDRRRHGKPWPVPAATLGPVAVVGAGPAGLACAAELRRLGVAVTVFDPEPPGGLLRHGIPAYRLPRDVLDWEVGLIAETGVSFACRRIERPAELLGEGFVAVFLAVGMTVAPRLGIPGQDLDGVVPWPDFLRDDWNAPLGRRVVVVGGGNSAVDAARVALRRMGLRGVHLPLACAPASVSEPPSACAPDPPPEVTILYRRSAAEMPAFAGELRMAAEEGVCLRLLAAPLAVLDDGRGHVAGLRCVEMRLGAADGSGRPRPEPVPGSEFLLDCDCLVAAIGQSLAPSMVQPAADALRADALPADALRADAPSAAALPALDSRGRIAIDSGSFRTSVERIFAGGDAVNGGTTVVRAVAEGREAARSMHAFLNRSRATSGGARGESDNG